MTGRRYWVDPRELFVYLAPGIEKFNFIIMKEG